MKIFSYLIVLLLLASCNQGAKTSSETEHDSIAQFTEPVKQEMSVQLSNAEDIKAEYIAIISAIDRKLTDSVSFKYDCNGEKRGTVTQFSVKGKVRMIKHSYGEYDHFEATDQYFVKDSFLFFVYSKELTWSFDSNATNEGGTKDNITEKRTYIINQQAIKCLEKKYVNYSYKANPHSSTIANKEVKCEPFRPIQDRYENLQMFIEGRGKGCPLD